MGRIIGIDLGTTTSEIAYIKNGKPEIIISKEGARIIPSVVSIKNGEILVGVSAKKNYAANPENTVTEIKRLMGTSGMVSMDGKDYLPEDISAIILKSLKEAVEIALGEEVTEAVITVPANFNDLERSATKRAGEKAGFIVERIINEPTAAAMAYGIDNMEDDSKILVYDLGGGTFDVTVLELFEGILDVKASRGNNKLGGKDFDNKIVEFIVSKIKEEYSVDVTKDERVMARVNAVAEEVKKDLTNMSTAEINLMYLISDSEGNPINVEIEINRNEFEEMIFDLVMSTKNTIMEALEASKYTINDIEKVLVVGGSTRVPLVKKMINDIFGDKIKSGLNPDEAVALGAAVQAGIKNNEIKSEDCLVVTDTCYFTMGVEIIKTINNKDVEGVFDPLIYKDSKMPAIEKTTYITANDYQTSMLVQVYQGDGAFVKDNIKIGEVELDGIPEAPRGQEEIEVEFRYNLNGILEVSTTILSNGKRVDKLIDTSKVYVDANQIVNESKNLDVWDTYPLASLVSDTIELAERRMQKINPKFASKVKELINKIKEAVINNNKELASNLDNELTDLLFDL